MPGQGAPKQWVLEYWDLVSKIEKNPNWPRYLVLAFQFVFTGSVISPSFHYKTGEEHKLGIWVISESEDAVDGQSTMGFSLSIMQTFNHAVTNGY